MDARLQQLEAVGKSLAAADTEPYQVGRVPLQRSRDRSRAFEAELLSQVLASQLRERRQIRRRSYHLWAQGNQHRGNAEVLVRVSVSTHRSQGTASRLQDGVELRRRKPHG